MATVIVVRKIRFTDISVNTL